MRPNDLGVALYIYQPWGPRGWGGVWTGLVCLRIGLL
jgi:hypothetical protein